MVFRTLPFLVLFLAAACGSGEEEAVEPNMSNEALAETLERVHVAKKGEDKPANPGPQLGFLREEDMTPAFRGRPSCRLGRDRKVMLVAVGQGAVARIDGRPVRLAIAGPVGPSGGFFEGEGYTVSVGRRTPVAPRGDAVPIARRAGVTIGGAKDAPLGKAEALWVCSG